MQLIVQLGSFLFKFLLFCLLLHNNNSNYKQNLVKQKQRLLQVGFGCNLLYFEVESFINYVNC